MLFMFAGWFIGDTTDATPAKNYISFVMTTVRWMLLPVAVLLSCWGLPADIRDRSLHTVVTKQFAAAKSCLDVLVAMWLS